MRFSKIFPLVISLSRVAVAAPPRTQSTNNPSIVRNSHHVASHFNPLPRSDEPLRPTTTDAEAINTPQLVIRFTQGVITDKMKKLKQDVVDKISKDLDSTFSDSDIRWGAVKKLEDENSLEVPKSQTI